jgi:hypothetical protein
MVVLLNGTKKVYTIFFVVFFLLVQLDVFSSPFQIILKLKLKFSEVNVRVEEVSLCYFLFQILLFF